MDATKGEMPGVAQMPDAHVPSPVGDSHSLAAVPQVGVLKFSSPPEGVQVLLGDAVLKDDG